jgi:resuscitation-promoting factor RpfB
VRKWPVLAVAAAVLYAGGQHAAGGIPAPAAVPAPSGSNEALANGMAGASGWAGGQITCLDYLWTRESGFSATADTRITHAGGDTSRSRVFAYGIAQARPASKYPPAGRPPDMGGSSDARTQIAWGLGYIQGTYGTPCGAWAHEQADGWY